MRKRRLLVGIAGGLTMLAGCTGNADTDRTATQTATRTVTETETSTVDVPEGNVIAYDELSAAQQNAFDQALNGSANFGAGVPSDVASINYSAKIIDPFRENDFVQKSGSYYELQVVRANAGRERLDAEPVEKPDGPIVRFEDLSGEGVETLKRAIEEGSVLQETVTLPESVEAGSVVQYEDEYYLISVRNIDYMWFTLTVDPVS